MLRHNTVFKLQNSLCSEKNNPIPPSIQELSLKSSADMFVSGLCLLKWKNVQAEFLMKENWQKQKKQNKAKGIPSGNIR